MAKIKLNSMPDYQAKLPRQPHDVSSSFAYTTAPGIMTPVYYDMLHAGDEVFFNGQCFTRLNPIIAPALGSIDVYVDYFFVPLTVMYTPSSSVFYQTDDLVSSVFNSSQVGTKFPVFDLDNSIPVEERGLNNLNVDSYLGGNVSLSRNLFDTLGKSLLRGLDAFGYNHDVFEIWANQEVTSNRVYNPTVTPWFALAYQACYQLYSGYRNFDRESKSYIYNIDSFYDTKTINARPYDIFGLRYCDSSKDYFNSVKFSPIGSSVSSLSSASYTRLAQMAPNSIATFVPDTSLSFGLAPGGMADMTQVGVLSPQNAIYSGGIRKLFAVDKLLRVTGRAEKNYESQFLAHYGVKIPHDSMHNITHIGSDHGVLSPSAIISSANTYNSESGDGSPLGEVGGQGILRFDGKRRSFKAPFHGVFIAISYHRPRFRYLTNSLRLHDLSDVAKFWQPEFDHLGMQPLYAYECYVGGTLTASSFRLGWSYNYEHFKRKFDRVSSAFELPYHSVNNYSPWVFFARPYSAFNLTGDLAFLSNGQSIGVFTTPPPLTAASFKIAPTSINNCLQVMYETYLRKDEAGWHTNFYSDPFICDFTCNCKKVNYMSEYGEPEL